MNLTIQDTKKLLMPYADGELTAAEVAQVERALAEHPEARAELDEIRRVSLFARDAFEAPVADVKLDGVYDAVMARIAAEDKAKAPVQQSAWARFMAWCGELVRFERPMALAGLAAAVVAIVVGVTMLGGPSSHNAVNHDNTVAKVVPGQRRGPEVEHAAGRNTAFVEDWEVAKGKVIIDVNQDDPDQPMVLWHVVEDEGTVAPKGL
ncbi:MAG: zf-HC2 domain-containing protein [Myxococcota bacterium]